MTLPLILAGPILRRVDPTLAAVWVALSSEAQVRLKVWEGQLTARDAADPAPGGKAPFVQSEATPTLRLGASLHLICLTARIPPESGKTFRPDTTYCYDLTITIDNDDHTLKSEGMLESSSDDDGVTHVALGYEPDLLPSFAPPPSELTDLRIVYGSCRKPAHHDPDAMVWIDDYILDQRRYKDPRARPHQLFLGGDQIYADDVHAMHLLMLMELGRELITGTRTGLDEDGMPLPVERIDPMEQIDVGRILRRPDPVPSNATFPRAAYVPSTDKEAMEASPSSDTRLPADRAHFPERHRKDLTQRAAQFTSTDGDNHLISIGEFAAMYLSVWSNAVWPAEVPLVRRLPDPSDDQLSMPLTWSATLDAHDRIQMPAREFPERIPLFLYPEYVPPAVKPDRRTPEEKQRQEEQEKVERERKYQRHTRDALRTHAAFIAGLSRVRRVLANVPTYMVLDDHDVTDDFFLNPIWRDRVLGTNLGQTILRNAMLTYALFQDWGNDPRRYDSGPRAELLIRASQLFPPAAQDPLTLRPIKAATDRLDVLFGHDLRNTLNEAGQYDSVSPPITWHFSVDGPKHRVVALDNRTRRSYVSDLGPPGNVSAAALEEQIPAPPLPIGIELLVVVAPLQVIGPPIIDDLLAPNLYRLFDLKGLSTDSDLSATSRTGMRGMTGTDPDAIEAWALDAVTFEHLLRRLADFGQVVLLSGDVHNASGTEMSYWRKDDSQPRRIVQFTSSGFKNVMPAMIYAVDRSAGFVQQLIRAGFGTERIGWLRAEDDLVLLPDGKGLLDIAMSTRKRLRTEPVMIPTWGWPMVTPPKGASAGPGEGQGDEPDPRLTSRLNPERPPDWRWRTKPLLDVRADEKRPEPIRPRLIDDAQIAALVSDPGTAVEAYQKIAARHQSSLGRLRNARQILFRSNFGLIRFERPVDKPLTAVHEVYTAFADPDDVTPTARPRPDRYLVQTATLEPSDEIPPGQLRARVLGAAPAKDAG
jgi:hypothetical protein